MNVALIVSGNFSSQCAIEPHSPLPTKTKRAKVEKYPPSLGNYNDSQARYSTSYQQISALDTARSSPIQHISEKSICIAYPDKYRKKAFLQPTQIQRTILYIRLKYMTSFEMILASHSRQEQYSCITLYHHSTSPGFP